jgi:hypothetical protein
MTNLTGLSSSPFQTSSSLVKRELEKVVSST